MGSPFGIDAPELSTKIQEKAHDIFEAKKGVAQLQVIGTSIENLGTEQSHPTHAVTSQDIENRSQIEELRHRSTISPHIFEIHQPRSWASLNISLELFEDLLKEYNIFPWIWRFALVFGLKFEENEFEFPGCMANRSRRSQPRQNSNSTIETFELAYMLRRVDRHGRTVLEGQSPWSIRQTAVYSQFVSSVCTKGSILEPRLTFMLIAPSESARKQVSSLLGSRTRAERPHLSSKIHLIIIKDSLKDWMEYMAWLETQLKAKSNRVVFADVGTKEKNLSPLTNFNINFMDRQALKLLEDSITELRVILPTLFDTIVCVREQCRIYCDQECAKEELKCNCEQMLRLFDEYIKETELLCNRARVLRDKARSTTQLMSDLLSYENAVALKDVTYESQRESKAMIQLTERSTKDAAATKILTIIGLIYLPTTIVANFFSTEFVQTSDSGGMYVSNSAWLLAAVAIPLTIITIAIWWLWTCPKTGKGLWLSGRMGDLRSLYGKVQRRSFRPREGRVWVDIEKGNSPEIKTNA